MIKYFIRIFFLNWSTEQNTEYNRKHFQKVSRRAAQPVNMSIRGLDVLICRESYIFPFNPIDNSITLREKTQRLHQQLLCNSCAQCNLQRPTTFWHCHKSSITTGTGLLKWIILHCTVAVVIVSTPALYMLLWNHHRPCAFSCEWRDCAWKYNYEGSYEALRLQHLSHSICSSR